MDLPVGDEEQYSIALQKWIHHKDGIAYLTYPDAKEYNKSLRLKRNVDKLWKVTAVEVIGYYDDYEQSKKKMNQLLAYKSTSEPDSQCARKKKLRKKKTTKKNEYDYDEDSLSPLPTYRNPPDNLSNFDNMEIVFLPTINEDFSTNESTAGATTLIDSGTMQERVSGVRIRSQEPAAGTTAIIDNNVTIPEQSVTGRFLHFQEPAAGATATMDSNVTIQEESMSARLIRFEEPVAAGAIATIDAVYSLLKDVHAKIIKCEILLSSHTDRLITIERRLNIAPQTQKHVVLKSNIPLTTIEELETFEKTLECEEQSTALFSILKNVSGANARNCLFKLFGKVFEDELATKCSWKGRKQNYKMEHLRIVKIIINSARESFPNLNEKCAEQAGIDWFRFANQRLTRTQQKK
ncbi:hypothetical protein FQR65_LT04613 [Abscondita terminalis]|nr:hypothetical protein FQR65_LT04613 [Abscondita terminalis]